MPMVRSDMRSELSTTSQHSSDDIVFVLDAAGRVRVASHAGALLVGLATLGAPVWELPGFARHPSTVAWLRAHVADAATGALSQSVETTVGVSARATWCVLSLSLVPSTATGTSRLLLDVRMVEGPVHDAIEPELAALGAGLALLADGSDELDEAHQSARAPHRDGLQFELNDAIQLLADAESGRILDANAAAVTFYGWPRETMQSMLLLDLDSTSVAEWRTLAHSIVTGASRRVPLQHRVASGALRSVDTYGRRLTLDGRQVLHIFVRDACERLRADRLMRESEEGLRIIRKLQAVCELTANTAHEFNSLLTVIAGSAGFLRHDLAGRDRELDDIASIERASERAEELTRQLLVSVRGELPRMRTVDLSGQLYNAMPAIRERLGLNIRVELPPVASPVLARLETAELPDVFWTLLDYAKSVMPAGGVVTLSTALVERDEEGGRAHYAVLSVTDSGVDVHDASRAQLVEALQSAAPFRIGAGSTTATDAAAFVSVNATPGVGTTCHLHFPAAHTMPVPVTMPTTERARRVVLVSREPQFRDITRRMLQKLSLEVVMVESGDEALVALDADASAPWDVVTDLNVRGISGIALIDALRTRTNSVVLLAGSDIESGVRRSLETRAVQRLDKPFTIVELERALRAARAATAVLAR